MRKSDKVQSVYWFRQRYHVWDPASWKGWVAIIIFTLVMIANISVVAMKPYSNQSLWLYLSVFITAVATLLLLGHAKAPVAK